MADVLLAVAPAVFVILQAEPSAGLAVGLVVVTLLFAAWLLFGRSKAESPAEGSRPLYGLYRAP